MSLARELLCVLDNAQEPLAKRLKIADNAFKFPDLPLRHREAFLLKWVFQDAHNNLEKWNLAIQWLGSEHFKDLSRNEISYDDIKNIVLVVLEKLESLESKDVCNLVTEALVQFLGNRIVQQYFTYQPDLYCELLSKLFESTTCAQYLVDYLKKNTQSLFYKNLIVEETFQKCFLKNIVPTMVNVIKRFHENGNVFLEFSSIVQKCIFRGNAAQVECFLKQFFEDVENADKNPIFKNILKYLVSYESEDTKPILFKLIFHAFCHSHNNFQFVYMFFVIIIHILGFDLSEKMIVNKSSKLQCKHVKLNASLHTFLELLEILSENSNTDDFKLKDLNLTNFLKNLLKSIMFLNVPSVIVYKIFTRSISVNPLVVESIANQIIVHTMLANNEKQREAYEELIVAIFEVFSKLHRIENFIAKIIPSIQNALNGQNEFEEIYNFTGINDIEPNRDADIIVDNMFTHKILECFQKCIYELASWQVINIFKTLLHHLRSAVDQFEDDENVNHLIFLEISCTLCCWLLQSVRIAEHTVAANVVEKFVKGLEELRGILQKFGTFLLNKEHNCGTIRSFLNLSYYWGDIYLTLSYYNEEINIEKSYDNVFIACNLSYLQSYLTTEQWCSISERINNFGEPHCKSLLQKLFVQKLRAMTLFEKDFAFEITSSVVSILETNVVEHWKEILTDKFIVNNLIKHMSSDSIFQLAEKIAFKDKSLSKLYHIANSVLLINAVNYVTILKIKKMVRNKKKSEIENTKILSLEVCSAALEDIFLDENSNCSEIFESIKHDFNENYSHGVIQVNEEKLLNYLKVLREFPVIFSSQNVQSFVLLCLFALHKDLHHLAEIRNECEEIITGFLQCCSYELLNIFDADTMVKQILSDFEKYDVVFQLFIGNVFKYEGSTEKFNTCVNYLIHNLDNQKVVTASLLVIKFVNKLKKANISAKIKEFLNKYKDKLTRKMIKLLLKNDADNYLIEPFAVVLKHYISNEENDHVINLLQKTPEYVNHSLNNVSSNSIAGAITLFATILNNKLKFQNTLQDNIAIDIWNSIKNVQIPEHCSHDFSKLINLILTIVTNEEFSSITKEILEFVQKNICSENYKNIQEQLKIWESVMSCNVNPVKMKAWQESLEGLFQLLLPILANKNVMRDIVKLEETIIQALHFTLTPALIDIFLVSPSMIMQKENDEPHEIFSFCISFLEKLLKLRPAFIMDRLPVFLAQYRVLLKSLCKRSNSDLKLNLTEVAQLSNDAHKMEKLTNSLVVHKKDMGRIAMYLIADILNQYEQITLYNSVKIHLNNCVYSLMSLCDNHSVSYLMRVLSSASTEMFKMMYDNYKRYYMFTGKV